MNENEQFRVNHRFCKPFVGTSEDDIMRRVSRGNKRMARAIKVAPPRGAVGQRVQCCRRVFDDEHFLFFRGRVFCFFFKSFLWNETICVFHGSRRNVVHARTCFVRQRRTHTTGFLARISHGARVLTLNIPALLRSSLHDVSTRFSRLLFLFKDGFEGFAGRARGPGTKA